jgi:hypothetical protein
MPKNTFLLIALLAIFAALVVGVNIGKRFNAVPETTQQVPSITPSPTVTPTPKAETLFEGCGITLTYPPTFTKLDIETGGAMLVDSKDTKQSIAIACQKDIPRPALPADKIQTAKIGSMSASLYHDTSAKDGTSVDKFIFRHPKTGLDVYVSGFGDNYISILSTLTLQ